MIIHRINNFLKSMLLKERSPEKLALSLCVGTYIAFTPFIGLHTAFTFLIAWLFRLNFVVMWIGSHLINNPWTMVAVYSAGYYVGEWFLRGFLGFDLLVLNPVWMDYCNQLLTQYIGLSHISLWAFLLGGNLLGCLLGILMYPVIRYLCLRVALQNRTVI